MDTLAQIIILTLLLCVFLGSLPVLYDMFIIWLGTKKFAFKLYKFLTNKK